VALKVELRRKMSELLTSDVRVFDQRDACRVDNYNELKKSIELELSQLKQLSCTGFEVTVKWIPGKVKYRNGKQLAEEVLGNTIFVYTENTENVLAFVRHGFLEWILAKYTKPYRQLINKLIELFEDEQYERKEKAIDAITKLVQRRQPNLQG
jgi:hypothetical protein